MDKIEEKKEEKKEEFAEAPQEELVISSKKPVVAVIDKPTMAVKSVEQNIAFAKAGIYEATGHNDGDFINKVEKVWGMQGEPYCAMGQYYNFAKTLLVLNGVYITAANLVEHEKQIKGFVEEHYLLFDPLVANMIHAAKDRGQWNPFTVSHDAAKIGRGDFICFNFGSKSHPQNHIEQFDKWDTSHIYTIGWNTSAGKGAIEGNDPKGGGGVFYKHRAPDPNSITGWIHWTV